MTFWKLQKKSDCQTVMCLSRRIWEMSLPISKGKFILFPYTTLGPVYVYRVLLGYKEEFLLHLFTCWKRDLVKTSCLNHSDYIYSFKSHSFFSRCFFQRLALLGTLGVIAVASPLGYVSAEIRTYLNNPTHEEDKGKPHWLDPAKRGKTFKPTWLRSHVICEESVGEARSWN